MRKLIHLPLYGQVNFESEDDRWIWDVLQSREHARLRDISLSSVPSRFAPHDVATTRFQHSVGIAYIADRLCDRKPAFKEFRNELIAAALVHDTGSAPFSHAAEVFSYALTGRTHEELSEALIAPGTELGKLFRKYGIDREQVLAFITGTHPVPLIAGSIDLDNIDNTVSLLYSMGYHAEIPYSPLRLIEAFRFQQGQLMLDTAYLKDLLGWAEARRTLYSLLYAEETLSASAMLHRALESAYAQGLLDETFFRLGESDALHFLRYSAGDEAAELIDRLSCWKHFPLLLETTSKREDMRVAALYDNWELRKQVTDNLARALKIPVSEFALYVGRDRGAKQITLPFTGDNAEAATALFSGSKGVQRIAVFAHKRYQKLRGTGAVEDALGEVLEQVDPVDVAGHVFT